MLPDNDDAGESYLRQIMFTLPKAQRFMVRTGKDIDGCRREHAEELNEDLRNINTPGYKFKMLIRR
jgi:hypothetical protein